MSRVFVALFPFSTGSLTFSAFKQTLNTHRAYKCICGVKYYIHASCLKTTSPAFYSQYWRATLRLYQSLSLIKSHDECLHLLCAMKGLLKMNEFMKICRRDLGVCRTLRSLENVLTACTIVLLKPT